MFIANPRWWSVALGLTGALLFCWSPVHGQVTFEPPGSITPHDGSMGHSLSADPNPVGVVLVIGERTYSMSYGGTVKFTANRLYSASKAPE